MVGPQVIAKIVIAVLAAPTIYIANRGPAGGWLERLQSLLFIGVFSVALFFPKTSKRLFQLALILLVLMVGFYVAGQPERQLITNLLGSSGFGIIVLLVLISGLKP